FLGVVPAVEKCEGETTEEIQDSAVRLRDTDEGKFRQFTFIKDNTGRGRRDNGQGRGQREGNK
ncbi:Hypothetical protein SMAX5B_002680, partial [Scophthalmus maximus]